LSLCLGLPNTWEQHAEREYKSEHHGLASKKVTGMLYVPGRSEVHPSTVLKEMAKVVVPALPLCTITGVLVIAVPVTVDDKAQRRSDDALAVLPPPLTVHVVAPFADNVHARFEFTTSVTATSSETPASRFACVTVQEKRCGDCESRWMTRGFVRAVAFGAGTVMWQGEPTEALQLP